MYKLLITAFINSTVSNTIASFDTYDRAEEAFVLLQNQKPFENEKYSDFAEYRQKVQRLYRNA